MGNRLIKFLIIQVLLLFATFVNAETVWIDVRSKLEHAIDSIEGDRRISYDEVADTVLDLYPDKSTEIVLYCRSGGRAEKALNTLKNAGYTNISNGGGIDEVRQNRGIK